MKKIVFFISSLSSGGAEHQLVQLADGLSEKGYDIIIATFADVDDFYDYSSLIHRHHIAPGKGKCFKMIAIWWFFLTLETDWVISFTQRANCFCLWPLLFRSRKKIKVIASERNATIGKPSFTERELMSFLYHRASYIVPNSETQKKHILKNKPVYFKKTLTISNYTDISHYSYKPLPSNNVIRIAVFSRYSEQKNCLRFVDVVKRLKSISNQKFVVEWYGDIYFKGSTNDLYKKIINGLFYGQTRVANSKTNLPFTLNKFKNVNDIMYRFDACCLPSLYEGFSNSIAEAICCGKPMLVSDVSDNSVMVHNGENGFLFNPMDVVSMCNAFLKFFQLTDDEKCIMAINSRKIAERLFNREHFIQQYINLLES